MASGDLREETIRTLKDYGIKPIKRLGQSFLVDDDFRRLTVDSLELSGCEVVLEIGAGTGTLTAAIAGRCGRIYAVEKDPRLVRVLEDRFSDRSDVVVIQSDVLEMEVPASDKVVSNVPYSISSPLLFKLLEKPVFRFAILALQREFVERLLARPGDSAYGRLTVSSSLRADIHLLGTAPPRAFYPEPEVDTHLVKVVPRENPRLAPVTDLFDDMLRYFFSQRKKVLRKVLRGWLETKGLERREIQETISSLGLPGRRRIFQLSPEDLLSISEAVYPYLKSGSASAHRSGDRLSRRAGSSSV